MSRSNNNPESGLNQFGARATETVKIAYNGVAHQNPVYHRQHCGNTDGDLFGARQDIESAFPNRRPAKCCFPEEYRDTNE